MNSDSIAILGGGVAGLIAAIELENAGHNCIIIEKDEQVGGRLKTDIRDKVPLDHGFQVLLTSYPLAKRYLDYNALELKTFKPGATIFRDGKKTYLGDPLRNLSATWSTISSWAGSINDKFRIYRLSRKLKGKSISEIFNSKELSTSKYLEEYGFSSAIIDNFFLPFFSGIFLENQLKTSSRMFEFVFKMFSEGDAAIPQNGISEIPLQLAGKLKRTKIYTNTMASLQDDGLIATSNGDEWKPRAIVTTYPMEQTKIQWKGCTTFYFKVDKYILETNSIGLVANQKALINSFYYLDKLNNNLGSTILSVTTLEHELESKALTAKIKNELSQYLGITEAQLITFFRVPVSLPDINDIGEKDGSHLQILKGVPVVKAGDYLNYGSLNGAMLSGQFAAHALLKHFESTKNTKALE